MCCVVSAAHVRRIRVDTGSSPAGVGLLRVRGWFYYLAVSYPHYNMSILRQHVALADAAFCDLGNVIFYCCRRGVGEMDTSCVKHLNHQTWTVEPNWSFRLKVNSGLSTSSTVVIHIVRSHRAKPICSSSTTYIQSTDVTHSIIKSHLKSWISGWVVWAGGWVASGGHVCGWGISWSIYLIPSIRCSLTTANCISISNTCEGYFFTIIETIKRGARCGWLGVHMKDVSRCNHNLAIATGAWA